MIIIFFLGTETLLCHDIEQNINKTGENQIIFNRDNETFCTSSGTWHWFNDTTKVSLAQVRYRFSVSSKFFIFSDINHFTKNSRIYHHEISLIILF